MHDSARNAPLKEIIEYWLDNEIHGEKYLKSMAPPYSPNVGAEFAHFVVRGPSCEYF